VPRAARMRAVTRRRCERSASARWCLRHGKRPVSSRGVRRLDDDASRVARAALELEDLRCRGCTCFARHAILDVLALETGDHLLELGCGRGSPPRRYTRGRCACEVLDHSEEMVELARSARPARGLYSPVPRACLVAGTPSALSLMSIIVFLIEEPIGVLRECRRVLRRRALPSTRGDPSCVERLRPGTDRKPGPLLHGYGN
jgi:ubiquinone/menaquinone biosynthesis C-methylase UbiE